MEENKQQAGNFSGWVRGTEEVTKDCVFINGQESYPLHAGDENWIDCNSEEIARRIVACVNACAGIDTEHLEQAQADHAEESEGGYLADVETRLEHTERELAHRSAALFERQQRVLSVMDGLRHAVEARLAAEAQLQAERASLFAENQRKQQLEQQCAQLQAERDRAERALRAAGWTYTEGAEEWRPPLGPSASPLLDKIDQLQAEREACAAICDRYAKALDHGGNEYTRSRECQQAAAAIRARQEAQQ